MQLEPRLADPSFERRPQLPSFLGLIENVMEEQRAELRQLFENRRCHVGRRVERILQILLEVPAEPLAPRIFERQIELHAHLQGVVYPLGLHIHAIPRWRR